MATRVLAGVIIVIVVVYHVLRLLASQCSGGACDWYIPFSLFLPLLAILLAALTGGFAAYGERARRGWAMAIGLCAILATLGAVFAAIALSDNDTKVWVSTVLVLTVPVAVFISATARRGLSARGEGQ